MKSALFRCYYFLNWIFFLSLFKVLFRLKVYGRSNVPRAGGVILASNHASYLDPPVIGVVSPRQPRWIAKQELFTGLPGLWYRSIGGKPVRRGGADRAAYKESLRLLKAGHPLTIYPEGTRTLNGNLLPGQPGIARLARRAGVPIVPIYIHGTFEAWPKGAKRLHLAKITVYIDVPISLEELNAFPDDKDGYQGIADLVMARINALRLAHQEGVQD